MTTTRTTQTLATAEIIIGTEFIPAGKKRPVTVFSFGSGDMEATHRYLWCESPYGITFHMIALDKGVEVAA